jgi:hypothetical protein
MIQIDDAVVSFDVFDKCFVCDVEKCRGECCVEGDAGAPLEPGEKEEIEAALPEIESRLTPVAKAVIAKQGVSYTDNEGDEVTSIVNGRECVFSYQDGNITKCALEEAYLEGRIRFRKPISCSLYPIRVTRYKGFVGVNYHRWKLCQCAEKKGLSLGVRVYEFLKEPLIRKFGAEWYEKLALAAKEYEKAKDEWRQGE